MREQWRVPSTRLRRRQRRVHLDRCNAELGGTRIPSESVLRVAPSGRDDQPERKVTCQTGRLTANSSLHCFHSGPSEGIKLKTVQ